MSDNYFADDLTVEDIKQAYAVLENARDWTMTEGFDDVTEIFNQAHYSLQEYEELCVEAGVLEERVE